MSIKDSMWWNRTKLIVKEDGSPDIANHIAEAGHKVVLLAYGMGSVKKIGVYDKVLSALKAKGITVHELSGIRANPELSSVIEGIDICRKNKIEAILPLGGGSVIDCCKGIAVGATFPPDVPSSAICECYHFTRPIEKALPLYCVLTISATASEMDGGTVVQCDKE